MTFLLERFLLGYERNCVIGEEKESNNTLSSVSSCLAKGEVVVVVALPNANIPPATAQSGSTVASYHTGGQPPAS